MDKKQKESFFDYLKSNYTYFSYQSDFSYLSNILINDIYRTSNFSNQQFSIGSDITYSLFDNFNIMIIPGITYNRNTISLSSGKSFYTFDEFLNSKTEYHKLTSSGFSLSLTFGIDYSFPFFPIAQKDKLLLLRLYTKVNSPILWNFFTDNPFSESPLNGNDILKTQTGDSFNGFSSFNNLSIDIGFSVGMMNLKQDNRGTK